MFSKKAVSLLELFVVMIIIGIIATISIASFQVQLEKEYADNTKAILTRALQAEEVYFDWKNTYTDKWNLLEIDDPNTIDKAYEYTITLVATDVLLIKATRRGKTTGFMIDQNGTLSGFP